MQVWNVLHAARSKCRTQKSRQKSPSRHHRKTLSGNIFATKAHIDNRKKKLLSINMSYMVNFGPLAAEIDPVVWGTPAYFNGFRVLAALLHGTLVVGVSQTLRSWTEGVTYIRQATITLGIGPHSSSDEVRLAGSLSDFVLYLFWKKTFRDKWLRFFTGSCHQPNSVHAPNETFTKLIYTY